MIGAAGRVEAEVVPVAEVAEAVGGHAVADPVGGFGRDGAGEVLAVEIFPLGVV